MPNPNCRGSLKPARATGDTWFIKKDSAKVGAGQVPEERYPPIADYAFISDCHSMALVSCRGSIDWCCMPRVDAASVFGRMLDWDRGGQCAVRPVDGDVRGYQTYVDDTLVLCTTFRTDGGEARVYDCFTMHVGGADNPHLQLLRVLEGVRGRVDMQILVQPRFDYGEVKPWIRRHTERIHSAIGGNDGLLISCDAHLDASDGHELSALVELRADSRIRLSIEFVRPEQIEYELPSVPDPAQIDHRLEETLEWWRQWASQVGLKGAHHAGVMRSAIVLKGLSHAPTGAVAAAATTSLPETPGGSRNWDYRYSWIRDSSFSVVSLADIGCYGEADGFRRFVQRSSAGSARDLQIMYGLGGERRLTEIELPLEGWRGSRPVRIGNAAANQLQLDAYGTLVDLSWRWHQRGQSPDDDYWRFIVDLVEVAAERWQEPDRGIWEIRGPAQHFVHSKVMCWTALERGLQLAKECLRKAPVRRWQAVRRQIREAIEENGYNSKRRVFTQTFGGSHVDASLTLIPMFGFVEYTDPRMLRTADGIIADLERDGLILRYEVEKTDDGLSGREGTFLACSFWLAECLAKQGRHDDARLFFDRAASTASELGLFSEEYDTVTDQMLGNFPQGLTHLSHIAAAVALADARGEASSRPY